MFDDVIRSGEASKRFVRMVKRQGGDASVIHDPGRYPGKLKPRPVLSPRSGFISACDALGIGKLAVRLGAGRIKKEDSIDPEAGIWLEKKIGDRVKKGEPLAQVWTRIDGWESVEEELIGCYEFSDQPVTLKLIIEGVVDEKGVLRRADRPNGRQVATNGRIKLAATDF
jgi:pyrimidine-nucleoside phosphorylase